jgi:hypothetical protein
MKQNHILFFILITLCLLFSAQSANCSNTHFDFFGKYSLGKQDELNKTFTKIQEKITSLGNVTININDTTTYTIFNAKPTFYYRDSTQTSAIMGNDTVVIFGGRL